MQALGRPVSEHVCVRWVSNSLGVSLLPFSFLPLLCCLQYAGTLLPCSPAPRPACSWCAALTLFTSFSFLLLGRCVGSGGLRVLHDISPCASCRNFFQVRSGASAAAAAIASLAGCLPVRRDRKEKRERRRRNKHRWAHWSRATVQPAAPRKIPSPPPPSLSPLTIPTKAASFSFFLLSFFHAAPAPHRWALHAALDRSFYTRPAGGRRRRRRQRGEPVTRRSASIPPSSLTAAGAVAVGGYALRLVASSH